jgi:hypothetical protein
MDGQKLKELLRSETKFGMCGKNARSLSKERDNAAIHIKRLDDRLAARTEFQCKEILADRPPAD